MIQVGALRETLSDVDSIASLVGILEMTASEVESDSWKYPEMLEDSGEPDLLALLQRQARAYELYVAALKRLRTSLMAARSKRESSR